VTKACHDIQRQLSDLVDGQLAPEAEAAVRAHLRECADCSGVFADLERIVKGARTLGPVAPPDHIWLEVAGQIHLATAPPPRPRVPPARSPVWQWVGIAAALVLTTFGLYLFQDAAESPAPAGTNAAVSAPAETLEAGAGTLEAVNTGLEDANARYEQVLADLQSADPELAGRLRVSLDDIDRAVEESRAALNDNPASEPARDSLFEALRRKISVLQATATLINEMRQGDQEGAARAAEGLGKKS
jgi:hypothetical protein